jgi:hypothetical protein
LSICCLKAKDNLAYVAFISSLKGKDYSLKERLFLVLLRACPSLRTCNRKELNNKFKKAKKEGKKISYKWILCYAKKIYKQLYLKQVIYYKGYIKMYLRFKFSSS